MHADGASAPLEEENRTAPTEDSATANSRGNLRRDDSAPEEIVAPSDNRLVIKNTDTSCAALLVRLKDLKEDVSETRNKMLLEKHLWEKELKEFEKIKDHVLQHLSADALWAHGATKSLSSSDASVVACAGKADQLVARHRSALELSGAETANSFKQKLDEVGSLCRQELERIKTSVSLLRSLGLRAGPPQDRGDATARGDLGDSEPAARAGEGAVVAVPNPRDSRS